MARPLRLDHPGAVWHITSRGNERRNIFRDDTDRERFLSTLGRVIKVYRWRLHAYVLMSNHYHLLIETPVPTLSRGMRQLNGLYTQSFNRRHRRVGHLFQGRFKAILVEKQSHLLELARYVVLNPVRAGMTKTAGQWKWSSYRATAGLTSPPAWLEVDWTLAQLSRQRQAPRRYRDFVAQGTDSAYNPWEQTVSQIYLGGEAFRRRLQKMIPGSARDTEIPRLQRLPARTTLSEIIAIVTKNFACSEQDLRRRRLSPARLAVAYLARHEAVLRLSDFAATLGIKNWAASHLATSADQLASQSRHFRRTLDRLSLDLKSTYSQT